MPRRLRRSRAFANWLANTIHKDGRTESRIADAAGIEPRKWRRIKNEGRVPPEFELRKICAALNVSFEEVIEIVEHGTIESLGKVFNWHRLPDNFQRIKDLSRQYYGNLPNILSCPAITQTAWLPAQPIPLLEFDQTLKKQSAWHPDQPNAQLSIEATNLLQGIRYSEFLRQVAPEVRQDDNVCYRLLDVLPGHDTLQLSFGATRYRNFVDSCEVLSFELGQWCWNNPSKEARPPRPNGADLKARGPASHIFDFRNRNCAIGICTLLILKKEQNYFFYLQEREIPTLGPQIMEAPGGYHIVPSGTFQPDTPEDENHARDFSIWRNVLREIAEELLGVEEVRETIDASRDFERHPKLRQYVAGVDNGSVRPFFLGLCIHPPAAKPDLLTAVIVDTNEFDHESLAFIGNWEMKRRIHEARIGNLDRWVKDERMAPTGATCLAIVSNHLKAGRIQLL